MTNGYKQNFQKAKTQVIDNCVVCVSITYEERLREAASGLTDCHYFCPVLSLFIVQLATGQRF